MAERAVYGVKLAAPPGDTSSIFETTSPGVACTPHAYNLAGALDTHPAIIPYCVARLHLHYSRNSPTEYQAMKRLSNSQRWLARSLVIAVFAICSAMPVIGLAAGRIGSRLIPEEELRHLGLTRAWFAQVRLNPARNHIERAVLSHDRLTVLTSAGIVQEFNAHTGALLWMAPIGNENYPSLGPSVSEQYVALVNGSTLYVLDRSDGRPVITRTVGGAPGAAPALGEKYVFVPLVNGRIEGYSLDKDSKKLTPWYYQSSGRAMVAPLATSETLVWTTDTGKLYVGNSENPGMRFRMDTGSDIVAPPSYLKPYVYMASMAGELFSGDETTGKRRWKYATGFPIVRPAAPVGKRVFVTSVEPALHCVDAESGNALWEAPHVSEFSAASQSRVYGIDDLGALVVLDGAKGTLVGRYAADHSIQSLVNDQSDRLYLISSDGIIQCLRETGAKEPFYHNPKPVAEQKPTADEKQSAAGAEKSAEKPAAKESSSEKSAPAAKKAEKPAADDKPEKAEKPADFGVKDSDNPFGN
jgi:outer membrane protein assembly factor BamB